MRKSLLVVMAAAFLAGPLSAVAAAGPVDELFCRVADKLGYEWVRECGTGS